MRWTCDTSNITLRSKSSNDSWKCLKSALVDLSDCPVMHSRLTDLPPKTPDSQTSCDGTVERSVSVEQQIAGTDVQWPPTPTWGGLSGTVERSRVGNGMPVLPTCSAPSRQISIRPIEQKSKFHELLNLRIYLQILKNGQDFWKKNRGLHYTTTYGL